MTTNAAPIAHAAGTVEKDLLALLERERVDYRFALNALQRGLDHLEARRVDHPRHARRLGVGGHEVEEMRHLGAGVYHAVVHVHVDHHRAVAHLTPRYGQRLVVRLLLYESQEFAAARHVATLAHVDERTVGIEAVESREPRQASFRGTAYGGSACCLGGDGAYVLGGGAAASAHDIHYPFVDESADVAGHDFGSLVVTSHGVGDASVGVCADVAGGDLGHAAQIWRHLLGAERAVESHGE
jgi:phage-related protein